MPNPTIDSYAPSLTATQLVTLALYGALLWFLAAMLVRALAPMGALEGSARVLTYGLVVPGTIPALLIAQRIARLARDQIAIGVAVVTAAATLLDGIALAWFPTFYADTVEMTLAGAAVILWGAGVGLTLGIAMNGKRADQYA